MSDLDRPDYKNVISDFTEDTIITYAIPPQASKVAMQ
jgi:hypothetical protein